IVRRLPALRSDVLPGPSCRRRRGRLSTALKRNGGGDAMVTVRNHAKERLQAGELVVGVGLRQARTVDIGRIMKTAGYDFLFIDLEHNSMSVDLAGQISIAAQDAGITPVVRVPGYEHFHATRALDAGAQ